MMIQRWSAPKMLLAVGAVGCSLLVAAAAAPCFADAIAYWNFEDGAAGQPFTDSDGGAELGSGGSVDAVSGILMRGYSNAGGPSWSDFTLPSGDDLSMRVADNAQDGYVLEGALHNWSPTAWTIETHVYLNDLGGWNTIVGRDGSTQETPESDFYLQNNGIDDRFRINLDTVGGTRWVLDGDYAVEANRWYGLAARSDGAELSMWLDDGKGYQQIGSLDITAQSVTDNALPAAEFAWTFGRGWYDGGLVDRIDGYMDNVRFSDVALAPEELLAIELPVTLVAEVDATTGEIALRNTTNEPISFDYYLLESSNATLNPADGPAGWNSLDDQDFDAGLAADFNGSGGAVDEADLAQWEGDFAENDDSDANGDGASDGLDLLLWQIQYGAAPGQGDSWDEAGGSATSQLAELFLNNATTLAPGESVSLGAAFNPAVLGAGVADTELTLQYGVPGGMLQLGTVSFVSDVSAASAAPEPAGAALFALMAAGMFAGRRR